MDNTTADIASIVVIVATLVLLLVLNLFEG
jgi:hypothetical protein